MLGVPFGKEEKLWYLGAGAGRIGVPYYRNLVRGRPGRALRAVRDRELMAGIMGVPVARYKAYAFVVSSMYAGLGGVLLALVLGRVVPDAFGVALAIEFLAMVVIGGLGAAAGAVAGAAFVILPAPPSWTATPSICRSSRPRPRPRRPAASSPAVAAQFAYGAAVIILLLLEPGGARGRRPPAGAPPTAHPRRHPPIPLRMKESPHDTVATPGRAGPRSPPSRSWP